MNKILVVFFLTLFFFFNIVFNTNAYDWFDSERTVDVRYVIGFQLKAGDKLSPINLPNDKGTYFRVEEIPKNCEVEIYKFSNREEWKKVSSEFSDYKKCCVNSDSQCPLLDKGFYVFKAIIPTGSFENGESMYYFFGPKGLKKN